MAIKRFVLTGHQGSWDEMTSWLAKLEMPTGNKKYEAVFNNDYKRSDEISRLSHVYYNMIAEETGCTPKAAKINCKRKWGIDALRVQAQDQTSHGETARDSLAFMEQHNYSDLTEQGKNKFIHVLKVTSIFTNKSMRQYMLQMEAHFAEQNLILKSINDIN